MPGGYAGFGEGWAEFRGFSFRMYMCGLSVWVVWRWLMGLGQDSILSYVHGIGGVGDGVCIGLVYYCWFLLCLLLHMAVDCQPYWFCR